MRRFDAIYDVRYIKILIIIELYKLAVNFEISNRYEFCVVCQNAQKTYSLSCHVQVLSLNSRIYVFYLLTHFIINVLKRNLYSECVVNYATFSIRRIIKTLGSNTYFWAEFTFL